MAHGKSLILREIQPRQGVPVHVTVPTENSERRQLENALAKEQRTTRRRVAKRLKRERRNK